MSCQKRIEHIKRNYSDLINQGIITIGPNPCPELLENGPKDQFDSDGIKIPYNMTGRVTKLKYGSRHRNGDRYNANHKYLNYYMVGYYLTYKMQELIEMKTDGPNHSGCKETPRCQWAEPAFTLNDGKSRISSEWPHPKNHDPVTKGVETITLSGEFRGKWIGYGVAAYYNPQGFRVYDQWVDPEPFDTGGKIRNKWVRVLHCINTGQIMPNPRRPLPIEGLGLEAEVRCHKGKKTEMKYGKILEILPIARVSSSRKWGTPLRKKHRNRKS